jgi:hypothetical protein
MKTLYPTLFVPLVLVALSFFPTSGSASETRVDSTGGLTTILTDESTDLNLFLDGNPAGLVLLNTRDRVDLSGDWLYSDQEGPWGSNKQQIFTTIPRYTDDPIKYEGLMLFPDPHWAVQVLGDFLSTQGVPSTPNAGDTSTTTQYRTLIRGAYAFSFGALGLEILNTQSDVQYDPGLYWPNNIYPYVGLASGSSAQNQLLVKTGFITTFPATTSSSDPRWQVGGHLTLQPVGAVQNQALNAFYASSPAFPINNVITTGGYLGWGAELLYELPTVAKVRFSVNIVNSDADFAQTVPFTSTFFATTAKFHSVQYGSMDAQGAFKLTLPFSEEENIKLGGSIDGFFNNTNLLRAAGNIYDNEDRQQIGIRFGVGLESPKDYTMGFQWKSLNQTNGNNATNNPGTALNLTGNNYDYYQLALGGEKWVASTWAFRMGLVAELDSYIGTSYNTLTTTVDVGTGLEESFGRADFRFLLGQTMDANNSSNTVGLIGAELSATFFL